MAPSIFRSRRALTCVALAGITGGLIAATPANATERGANLFNPTIAYVQWAPAYTQQDGRAVFQVNQTDVPVLVRAEPGDLTLTDDDDNVLCTVAKADFERDTCDIHGLPAGEHTVKGTIINNHGLQQIPAVTILSYADEAPADSDTAVPAPGEVDPGFTAPEPVVAQPNPGLPDLGFTFPVVALPNPGETDPGFTAPEPIVAQPNPGVTDPGFSAGATKISLAGTSLAEDGVVTIAEFAGTPGQQWLASFDGVNQHVWTGGTVDGSGRFTLKLRIAAGEQSPVTFTTTDPRTGEEERYDVTVASAVTPEPVVAQPNPGETDPGFTIPVVAQPNPGETDPGFTKPEPVVAEPVVAQPNPGVTDPGFSAGATKISLAGTHLAEDGITVAEFAGTPGQQWQADFDGVNQHVWTSGTVDDSGRFTLKLRIAAGEQSPVTFTTTDPRTGEQERYDVTVASAVAPEPVVAQPNPGETDPGFTAPEPVVATPAPGDVDPGFTKPEPVVAEPIVAQPAPGDVDPGFSPVGDVKPGADLEVVDVETSKFFGGMATITLHDPSVRSAYTVQLFSGSTFLGYATVDENGDLTTKVYGIGLGAQTITVKVKGATVLDIPVTVQV
ncbi:hypothetical protein [Curtobacterium sp. ISL-83]|uniref:hypothetical protein n=1 Tax=Curtobacterium sp. ISL-83 TaxID=2819145 RepID=UPI001BE95080|nr:hypothetical protein [Curtobacterium sp. ISL-83]MBT2504039.1 hypothetical protein [Curtobacterium sp. ISL-83]